MSPEEIITALLSIQLDFEERQLANAIDETIADEDCYSDIGHMVIAAKYLFADN